MWVRWLSCAVVAEDSGGRVVLFKNLEGNEEVKCCLPEALRDEPALWSLRELSGCKKVILYNTFVKYKTYLLGFDIPSCKT